MSDSCVIVGASHAGVTLALQLRREGWTGSITLIGEESELPYHRPPLSKEHLAGQKDLDAMRLRPAQIYQDNDIELLLATRVTQIDRVGRRVLLSDGKSRPYSKLALCTGATVREFEQARGLDNVFYIRSAADIARLSLDVAPRRRAAVIGGGYIGLEAAAVLAQSGVIVTVFEMSERILQRVTSAVMSEYMQGLHELHGVEIRTGVAVQSIQEIGQEKLIRCVDGSESTADFIIVGIGVDANSSLAEAAGLEADAGIRVDEHCRTSDEHIFAAGDCTRHPSLIYQSQIRLESVQNANDQARVAAANICGRQLQYDAVPWFWSDQYSVKLQMVGLSAGYDQLVLRGTTGGGLEASFALFYLKQGVVIAADCVARPKEFMVSKQLVRARAEVLAERLQDEEVEPKDFSED
ncbi:MAG: FAD-dependent oxidoreductase [Pseudohongiellaceae bacterium]